ncbi:membrane protein [Asanoa ishikariensis]|uniref:Putative Holin-X, holin superfamily III n=1 Tax=Asanoa ishikariensis TaxID=137265 RepID=A0A1H3SA13_9ACTN|nr:phage holin family protein [Asanoa ishikariensis]GIF70272.1 membrane protein [Asanoa ishikariensis]SDZ34520.1 Putative Holin-X, holin superfamily III [Asanoa ishikariensis]
MVDARNAAAPPRADADPSTSELVQRATEQVSRLVRDELALAKAELTQKGKHAGIGIGLFGGAGGLAFFGISVLIATAVIAIDIALPLWLSALIVGAFLLILAGLFALVGKGQVKRAVPPVPTDVTEGLKADVQTVKDGFRGNGHHKNGQSRISGGSGR